MNNVATRDDINEVLGVIREFMTLVDNRFIAMESKFDGRLSNLESGFDGRLSNLESRFDGRLSNLESRFFVMESKFDSLESRFSNVETKVDDMHVTIDGFIGRIDTYEAESAARDIQFKRLTTWARKASKNTNTPFNNA